MELVDENLPSIPHHHEGQLLPIDEAVALVERVRASAEQYADRALQELAADVPCIHGIALRACPPLPATTAERITDYRSRNVADWVMYREVLAAAARSRGWVVHWYDAKAALKAAAQAKVRNGRPWAKEHRIAMAAAIAGAALHESTTVSA